MRTRTLLLTAALAGAGIVSSMAQAVYSVNVVGYVNLQLPAGFALIANPLNGTNNNLSTVIPAPPEGTVIFKYNATTQRFLDPATFAFGAWDVDYTIPPGEGFFIQVTEPTTVTFVGEVPQGTLSTALKPGFQLVGSQVPQEGDVTSQLGYTPDEGDIVFQWDSVLQRYSNPSTVAFGDWDVQPHLKVGEGMWLQRAAAGAWTRTFNVNP